MDVDFQAWGGAAFTSTDAEGKPGAGTTVWSIGPEEDDHFAPSYAPFMVNYRVEDLHALVKVLRKKAATCSRRSTTPSTGSLPGSSIQRETRSSCGSRLKANEADRYGEIQPRARAGEERRQRAGVNREVTLGARRQ